MFNSYHRFKNGQIIEFQLSNNSKNKIRGKIINSPYRNSHVWTKPIRFNGKFAKQSQKNVLCIHKKMIHKIIEL